MAKYLEYKGKDNPLCKEKCFCRAMVLVCNRIKALTYDIVEELPENAEVIGTFSFNKRGFAVVEPKYYEA